MMHNLLYTADFHLIIYHDLLHVKTTRNDFLGKFHAVVLIIIKMVTCQDKFSQPMTCHVQGFYVSCKTWKVVE